MPTTTILTIFLIFLNQNLVTFSLETFINPPSNQTSICSGFDNCYFECSSSCDHSSLHFHDISNQFDLIVNCTTANSFHTPLLLAVNVPSTTCQCTVHNVPSIAHKYVLYNCTGSTYQLAFANKENCSLIVKERTVSSFSTFCEGLEIHGQISGDVYLFLTGENVFIDGTVNISFYDVSSTATIYCHGYQSCMNGNKQRFPRAYIELH